MWRIVLLAAVGGCLWTNSREQPDAYVPADEDSVDADCAARSITYAGQLQEETSPYTRIAGASVRPHDAPERVVSTASDGTFSVCAPRNEPSPGPLLVDLELPDGYLDAHILDVSPYYASRCAAITPASLAAAAAVLEETVDPERGVVVVYERGSVTKLDGSDAVITASGGWARDTGSLNVNLRMFINVAVGTAMLDYMTWPLTVPVVANEVTCVPTPLIPI